MEASMEASTAKAPPEPQRPPSWISGTGSQPTWWNQGQEPASGTNNQQPASGSQESWKQQLEPTGEDEVPQWFITLWNESQVTGKGGTGKAKSQRRGGRQNMLEFLKYWQVCNTCRIQYETIQQLRQEAWHTVIESFIMSEKHDVFFGRWRN